MNGSTSVSPATYWLTWPLQFAELATQTFRGNGIQAAPDVLAQNINPWTININSNNSSAPGTEQRILARHSYGRQLGRLMDAVDLLVNDLEARKASTSGDERQRGALDLESVWSRALDSDAHAGQLSGRGDAASPRDIRAGGASMKPRCW